MRRILTTDGGCLLLLLMVAVALFLGVLIRAENRNAHSCDDRGGTYIRATCFARGTVLP